VEETGVSGASHISEEKSSYCFVNKISGSCWGKYISSPFLK